jgi:predicted CxxxxCH...CXXCH cytochrome family protein
MAFRRPNGRSVAAAGCAVAALTCCGGGTVSDPPLSGTQVLAFAYFQRCVNPIFLKPLQITVNGVTVTNTCAAAACHNNATGAGGAFRIIPTATVVDLTDPANTPGVIRASAMYKNFYSAQGETVIGSASLSLLLNKPLVRNVLHAGGRIFASDQDPNVRLIEYWIGNPSPQGQDEFSTATYAMFTPPANASYGTFSPQNAMNGACNSN